MKTAASCWKESCAQAAKTLIVEWIKEFHDLGATGPLESNTSDGSILVEVGKEIKRDTVSNGEWKR